jgi:hypothetical protein
MNNHAANRKQCNGWRRQSQKARSESEATNSPFNNFAAIGVYSLYNAVVAIGKSVFYPSIPREVVQDKQISVIFLLPDRLSPHSFEYCDGGLPVKLSFHRSFDKHAPFHRWDFF